MSLANFGSQMLAEIRRIAEQIVRRDGTHLRWATITSTSPLHIRYDGETDPSIITPQNLAAGLRVGDRVRVAKQNGQATIIGRAGGSRPQRWSGAPFAEAAGTATITGGGTLNRSSVTVTFPTDRFTQTPVVDVSAMAWQYSAYVSSVTRTAAVIGLRHIENATWSSTNQISWRAVQMTPTSGSG